MPPGIIDGQKIKIKGLGHASDVFQGVSGDLLLHVKVKAHSIFKREGKNIVSDIQLNLSEAILGTKLTVETVDGKRNINVNPGVNNGDEMILKYHGMP